MFPPWKQSKAYPTLTVFVKYLYCAIMFYYEDCDTNIIFIVVSSGVAGG